MENYIIYCHTNKINGKKYIGQTKNSPQKRWGHNGYEYIRKQPGIFKNAILKYGWDNFDHEILFTGLTKEEANQKEIELIAKFKTNDRNYGYNLTAGGQTNTLSEEQKKNRVKQNYEMWENGVFKKAICNAVYCIELNYEFESALEAQRITGVDNSSINKVCKGSLKYAGFSPKGQPLHWVFANDLTDEKISELKNKKEILKGIQIPVECLTTQKIFSSSAEASEYYHVDTSAIRKCIRGQAISAGKDKNGNKLQWAERPELIKTKNKISNEVWNFLIGSQEEKYE